MSDPQLPAGPPNDDRNVYQTLGALVTEVQNLRASASADRERAEQLMQWFSVMPILERNGDQNTRDLRDLERHLDRQLDELGTQLRKDMNELGVRLSKDVNELGTQLRSEMNGLGTRLDSRIHKLDNLAHTITTLGIIAGSTAGLMFLEHLYRHLIVPYLR
jgi:hypothetical protein